MTGTMSRRLGWPTAAAVVALGLTLYGTSHVYKATVRGHSMEAALHDGDRLWSESFPNLPDRLRHGDLVIAGNPYDTGPEVITKRIAGMPGDVVDGYQLQAGEYYLLGDNTDHSTDSRVFGPVTDIRERVFAIRCPHEDRYALILGSGPTVPPTADQE